MKPRFFILFAFFVLGSLQESYAQLSKQQRLDSLRTKWQADSAHMYRFRKYSLIAGFDTRNSFVSADKKISVKLQGAKAGVKIMGKHNLELGYYFISNLPSKRITEDNGAIYDLKLNLDYVTLYYEYILLNNKRWEIGFPVELGGGGYRTTATDTAGKRYAPFKDTATTGISLFGAGVDVSFKIFKWLGVGAMGGYRFVGGEEPKGMNFNGVFYSVGLEIYFGTLYKMSKFGLKRRSYRRNVEKIKILPD